MDNFNYKENGNACDRMREPAKAFAERWNIPETVAYNAFLEAAEIERDYQQTLC